MLQIFGTFHIAGKWGIEEYFRSMFCFLFFTLASSLKKYYLGLKVSKLC